MKTKISIEFYMTEKMLHYFYNLPFEPKSGELALPTQRDNSETRYLNNLMELGLLYEVVIKIDPSGDYESTFYLSNLGKILRKKYGS